MRVTFQLLLVRKHGEEGERRERREKNEEREEGERSFDFDGAVKTARQDQTLWYFQ